MANARHAEFSLHIHKRIGDDGCNDRYTIGLWSGDVLGAICHAAPLDIALSALRLALENKGRSAEMTSSAGPHPTSGNSRLVNGGGRE